MLIDLILWYIDDATIAVYENNGNFSLILPTGAMGTVKFCSTEFFSF